MYLYIYIYIYIYTYIYSNLPGNVRLFDPWSGDSKGQKTLLARC